MCPLGKTKLARQVIIQLVLRSPEYCEIFCGGKSAIMNDFKEVIFHINNKSKRIKYKGDKGHKEEIEYFISCLTNENNKTINCDIFTTTEITIRASDKSAWNRVIEL